MPPAVPVGSLATGDAPTRQVSARIAGVFATTTALRALAPRARADGMLAIVAPAQLWVFNAASSAGASSTVLVPDAGTGRWLGATIPA
jgi:hypothetical protein